MKLVPKIIPLLLCLSLIISFVACKPTEKDPDTNTSSGAVSSEPQPVESQDPGDNDGQILEPEEEEPDYNDEDDYDYEDPDGDGDGGGDFVFDDEDKIADLPDSIKDVNDYDLLNQSNSYLKLTVRSNTSASENKLQLVFSEEGKNSYVFSEGDYLEYYVMTEGNTLGTGLVDLEAEEGARSLSRIVTAYDMEGLRAGKGESLGSVAANKWYLRRIKIPAELVGKKLYRWTLYQSSTVVGQTTITYFDNIRIVNGGKEKLVGYQNGKLQKNTVAQNVGIDRFSLRVTKLPKKEIIPQGDFLRMVVKSESLQEKQSAYIAYMISKKGKGTYKLAKGDVLVYKIQSADPFVRGGTVDLRFTDNTWLSDTEGLKDANGFSVRADENLSSLAGGTWYYRSVTIPESLYGKTLDYTTLSTLNLESGSQYEIRVADVKIINGNKTKLLIYGGGVIKDGGLVAARNATVSISKNHSVSNIGSPSGDILKFSLYSQNITKATAENRISSDKYEIKEGDCLEYDIRYDDVMVNSGFAVQLGLKSGTNIRFSGWRDQNAISGSSGIDISSKTANKWYHRKINLGNSVGEVVQEWMLACELASTENTGIDGKHLTAYFDNIRITNNGKTVHTVYQDGAPKESVVTRRISNDKCIVSSVPLNAPKPLYSIPTLSVPAEDVPVITYNVKNFGAKGDGKTDDTNAVQSALYAAQSMGGGVVFVPAGKYRIAGLLNVPEGVTLRGEWKNPLSGGGGQGTILMAYSGKGDVDGYSFIVMEAGSALSHISVWYPEQNAASPVEYPWTIQTIIGDSVNIKNVTLYNSFRAMKFGPRSNAVHMVENVFATALQRGLENDCDFDSPRFVNLTFSPDVWAGSNLTGAPSGSSLTSLRNYLVNNFEALRTGRVDFFIFYGITVDYAKIGLRFSEARDIEPHSITQSGAFANGAKINLNHVNIGIQADEASKIGIVISGGSINADQGTNPVAIKATSTFNSYLGLNDVTLSSTGQIATGAGKGTISLQSCKINNWNTSQYAIEMQRGVLMAVGNHFAKSGNHISLAKNASGGSVSANTFTGTANISNLSSGTLAVSHDAANLNTAALDATYTFRNAPKPKRNKVYPATDNGVKGDGVTDDTAAIQSLIDRVAAEGGGIVYFPAGNYVIKGRLTVKEKVELRGIYTSRHNSSKTASSMFMIYSGRNEENGAAAVVLKEGAGLSGIDFFYPEQMAWNIVPYSFTVQSQGSDTYLMNSVFVNAYQGADFGSHNSDRHFISGVGGTFLRKGIFSGKAPTWATVENTHIIMNYWIFYKAYGYFPAVTNPMEHPVYRFQGQHLENYIFGDSKNVQSLASFCWSGAKSAVFVDQGSGGFSGRFVVPGFDGAPILMDVYNAQDINVYSPFLYAHGLDVYTTRSYLRSYASNQGKVNIVNSGAGENSYPKDGLYVEGGTIDVHQFNFASSSKNYNVYATGGTIRLSGITACPITGAYPAESDASKRSIDLYLGSGVNSVTLTGYVGINRSSIQVQNQAGSKYQATGLATVK